jgi:selenoprotein W-related protein
LTDEILGKRELEYFVRDWVLVPGSGGVFEFEVNGKLLFSKKALGRHAQEGEILALFTQVVEDYKREHNIVLTTQEG